MREKPPLLAAGIPSIAAYNFLLTWADGFGGLRRGDLEWYFSEGEGQYLTTEEKELAELGVRALINEDRRLANEELERARNNK